jgi:hypothetical protein
MEWLDAVALTIGFLVGWVAAMIYYRRLCSVAASIRMVTLGVWHWRRDHIGRG